MRPSTKDKYLGIEIEYVSNECQLDVEEFIEKNKFNGNLEIGDDGSIDDEPDYSPEDEAMLYTLNGQRDEVIREMYRVNFGGSRYSELSAESEKLWRKINAIEEKHYEDEDYGSGDGLELRVLTSESELKDNLKAAKKVLDHCGARVNKTCGLHVHIDMRHRNMEKAIRNLHKHKDLLLSQVKDNRKTSTYCKMDSLTQSLADWNRVKKGLSVERYKAFNIQAYEEMSTLEVRLHHGTVDIKEIENWCRLLSAIVDGKSIARIPKKKAV